MGNERSNATSSPPIPRVPSGQLSERSVSEDNPSVGAGTVGITASASSSAANKFRSSKSASAAISTERGNTLQTGYASGGGQSGSFEHLPTLRVRNEELQRSVSSPQTNREIITLENPRSSHCPVIRPGPALGCNFCWNTIDGHGRILRRKTKYHCPECQTNLCIVPCFQEYHERLNNEIEAATAPSTTTTTTTNKTTANSFSNSNAATINSNSNQQQQESRSSTQTSSATATRHYTKTEAF